MSSGAKWGRTGLIAIGVTAVHFVLTFLALFSEGALALGPASWWVHVLAWLLVPLSFPVILALPGSQEVFFGLMLANSMVWGAALALYWHWWGLRYARWILRLAYTGALRGPRGRGPARGSAERSD
jgi:hypothetical protein